MPSKLEDIVAATRERIAATRASADLRALAAAAERYHPRGFGQGLRQAAGKGIAVIAELKKASPSKGLIRENFSVAELARELEAAGAAALSVLTDERFFQGSLENLEIASQSTQLPCLRKDFIVDEFQLLEARAHRADAVLLIVAALTPKELGGLHRRARQLQLDVLCEVHDAEELQRALDAGCEIVGVNNRSLHTFEVDLSTSLRLVERMPAGVLKVAESGIETGDDIARLRQAGFDAFLVGESLMRAPHPGVALRELLGPALADPTMTWIKICATTNLADGQASVAASASALGFIFAPSTRRIEVETAAEIIHALPAGIEKIGVFVNDTPEDVAKVAQQAGLTGVQLHGDEPAAELTKYRQMLGGRKLIKTLQARELLAGGGEQRLQTYLDARENVDAILLDSGVPSQRGGTGVPFDWESALPIAQKIRTALPLIIAGGLNAENVGRAIQLFGPWGVDVVSGVERATGSKDDVKLRSFVAAVRKASIEQPATGN